MPKRTPLRRILSEAGPLIAVAVAAAMLFGIAAPASAQFFDFGFGGPPPRQQQRYQQQRGGFGGGFGGGFFAPFQQIFPGQPAPHPQQQQSQPQQQRAVDYSRAPSPEKRETPAEHNVLVLGDAMADWLAYGLEDAFAEQPDMGVIRKHKTVSGLIRYQPKGEPADWAAAAKGILANTANDKVEAIVVMLGLSDRIPIREPADSKTTERKDARAKGDAPAASGKPETSDPEQGADDQADGDTATPEKSTRSANGIDEFRDDRWVELYAKKIEEMIAVLKSKGVPVIWVGLPAVRGQKATSDMLFLDALYRDGAGKAGITYVDVWDGFVDESGRFMQQGPDFEGQTRRLRTADGVFFTKAGARKLAHYVEREITRLLAARSGPVALPSEPGIPDVSARPGGPPPRPLAGPIVPLVAPSVNSDELLGGPGGRSAAVDALAARTLVKGDPLVAPAGRADDFAWPRREVARAPAADAPGAAPVAKTDAPPPPVASAAPDAAVAVVPAAPAPASPPKPKKKRVAPAAPVVPQPGPFGFFDVQPQWPNQQVRPRPPRPPGTVGRAASAPGDFFFMR